MAIKTVIYPIFFAIILCILNHSVKIASEITCDEKEAKVQKLNKQVESNGCSKPEFLEVKGEEDFTYCCDRHDACYAMCGSSKAFCDEDFKKCMKRLCDNNFKSNPDCNSAASLYALGTNMFGVAGFEEAQNDNCMCIPSSDVTKHYATLIDEFYTKYVKKSDRKDGKTIVSNSKHSFNSGTMSEPVYKNMYRIYYELHKKYDSAIKHIGKRAGRTVEAPRMSNVDEL